MVLASVKPPASPFYLKKTVILYRFFQAKEQLCFHSALKRKQSLNILYLNADLQSFVQNGPPENTVKPVSLGTAMEKLSSALRMQIFIASAAK